MKNLKTFVGCCILVLSLSVAALADGGIAQTPGKDGSPPPPSNCTTSSDPGSETSTDTEVTCLLADLTSLAAWLAGSIL